LNKKINILCFLLLLGFGWELQLAHASYHGPIAFSLLALASLIYLYQIREIKQD
jgi:hypothetical protein